MFRPYTVRNKVGQYVRLGPLLLVLICFSHVAGSDDQQELYDVVIRGGRVLDGAGNPWVHADVAIKNGKIAKVGHVVKSGAREIDASGHYVSPGWIDMMDQSGEVLRRNGLAQNKISMGVTTLIAGEVGTPVPAGQIVDYFAELEAKGISVNFGTYYSATQARVAVLGDTNIQPTQVQLKAMEELVSTAMEAGALGISTALIYPPGLYHSTEELIALARVAARYDGLYASHIRDESAGLLSAISEAIRIGDESAARIEIFHLKAAYQPRWGQDMQKALQLIDEARSRGVDVAADIYPYVAGGTGLDVSVPTWVYEDGTQRAMESLKDPDVRVRMKADLQAGPLPNWSNIVHASGGWKNVVLMSSFSDQYQIYEGKTLDEIGTILNQDPADAAWDIMLAAQPNRPFALYFFVSEEDVRLALKSPYVSIGSDAPSVEKGGLPDAKGLIHPRGHGTFPRIIARYVRDEQTLTLPDAIRKMTSLPASRMRLADRGVLKPGFMADIVVFNLEEIVDYASWTEPTAAPEGIEYVLVNGEVVLDGGGHTGATPGVVLRGPFSSYDRQDTQK